MVLLLFLQDTQRWWTAGGMTTPLGSSTDVIRKVHTRLVSARWATRVWEPTPGRRRRRVLLPPAGAERVCEALRRHLTAEDLVWAVSAGLSVRVLHERPAPVSGGEG